MERKEKSIGASEKESKFTFPNGSANKDRLRQNFTDMKNKQQFTTIENPQIPLQNANCSSNQLQADLTVTGTTSKTMPNFKVSRMTLKSFETCDIKSKATVTMRT